MYLYVWLMGPLGLYTVAYIDMRHEWHVLSVASDLCMHAVCCVVCGG